LVEFEFFTQNALKMQFYHLPKFILLSKIEPRKSMPNNEKTTKKHVKSLDYCSMIEICKEKEIKKHVKSLTRFIIVV